MIRRNALRLALVCWLAAACQVDPPDPPLRVAVASNFAAVLADLAPVFTADSGYRLEMSAGSTGKLYAQITHGAPFDVLLAADQHRPELLLASGAAVAGSGFTYAVGRLSLWSSDAARFPDLASCELRQLDVARLAMAQPDLAPYGQAAREALVNAAAWNRLKDRIVYGENVGQAFAMVATGNAEAGLLPRSLLVGSANDPAGSGCELPATLHAPIRQDAVLLQRAAANPAARAFLDFLQSARARRLLEARGYGAG